MLAESDFISLHCPGGAATKHLINEDRLKLMRPSAHLINTARGDVVDSKALVKALKERWIAGAGLDACLLRVLRQAQHERFKHQKAESIMWLYYRIWAAPQKKHEWQW